MYLKKVNQYLYITIEESYNKRVVQSITLFVNGSIEGSTIITTFTEQLFVKIIELFNQKSYSYELNQELKEIYSDISSKKSEFETHTKNALEIKHNLNENNHNFIDFLTVISTTFRRKLYDYQARAAYHMAYSLNSCNFSVPGAGKTSIVYSAFTYLKIKQRVELLIVVGPLSSFLPWQKEYEECFFISPRVMDLHKLSNEEKIISLVNFDPDENEIILINYEGLRSIKKNLAKFLSKYKCMLVLDEAHKIKNSNSQRYKQIMNFADNAVSRIVLTGTPIPNGYSDLYSLFEFIWPKKNIVGYSLNELIDIHKKSESEVHLKNLMNNIDPYYIRIKKEYLGLPKPVFHPLVLVQLGAIQEYIYKSIEQDFTKSIDEEDYSVLLNLKKAKLIRLMQCLTNPQSIKDSNISNTNDSKLHTYIKHYEKYETPPKFIEILKLVLKIINRNEKVIIWSSFVHNIKSLNQYLKLNGIYSETIYGNTGFEERGNIIDDFHTKQELSVLIANPAAIAESISLHKVCNNAIYLDKSFNAAQYMQSKDRIHRVGLPKNIATNYYFVISENTIDRYIHERVLQKEQAMLDVIEGDIVPLFTEDFGSDFSIEDMLILDNLLSKRE